MELSLTSGLDCLSPLRFLEVLDFEGVDHRINEAVLEWIVDKFRSLWVVGELEEHMVFGGSKDPKVEELQQYLSRLKPGVIQEVVRRASASERCFRRYVYSLPLATE